MNNLILGRYIPGDSLLHRLDPRSKLLAMFIYIIIIFWANNLATNLLMTVFTLSLVFLSGIKITHFLKGLRPMVVLILFTTLFQVFFTQGGQVLFPILDHKNHKPRLKSGCLDFYEICPYHCFFDLVNLDNDTS